MAHNKMRKLIILSIFIGLFLCGRCQEVICATDEVNDSTGLASMNRIIEAAYLFKSNEIYTVPVVVHIMHLGEPLGEGTNISDAQILSAIVALNEDFRKAPGTNGDGIGVDTQIEFCLAAQDPDGNATNGIIRVDATVVDGYAEEGISAGSTALGGVNEIFIKDLSRWPRSEYYNIWIVSEIRNNDGGQGVQGYAYFPNSSEGRDGTVILFNAFGTVGNLKSYTNLNRVTTHELGHAFFLYHTFQGTSTCGVEDDCTTDGDRVCDTPVTWENNSCWSPACDPPQMVENYMDYTSQFCMNAYTQGQKDRARSAIEIYRPELIASLKCNELVTGCLGDINQDGFIGIEDFIAFNSAFGSTCSLCPEDIDGNGTVDVEDFIVLNSVYGTSCGPSLLGGEKREYEPLIIKAYDMDGGLIGSTIGSNDIAPFIKSLPKGIYFLMTELSGKGYINKIIRE